ncbi:MAG: D-proline reductase (dithiol) PrdB, partial [Gammaproteobacteria bacterium]
MSAIAYYLEDEGIATTGISLVRENTASFQSPRFLWVSFPLGRPLGAPGDSAFQHRVIAHALDLLRRPSGPVLEDFDEDMPADTAEAFVCPVSF